MEGFKKQLSYLIDLGIEDETSTYIVRRIRILNVFHLFLFPSIFFMASFRFIEGNWVMFFADLVLIGIIGLAFYLGQKKKYEYASYLSIGPFLFFEIPFYLDQNFLGFTLYLIVIPIMSVIVMDKNFPKIFLLFVSQVLFLFYHISYDLNLSESILFFPLSIICFSLMLYFFNELKRQEEEKDLAILEREKANKELKSKNEEMILYSDIMTHDLKAPLRTIKGFSTLLKRKMNKVINEDEIEYLNFISNATNSMANLIDDLLKYSKLNKDEYNFESIDLKDMIEVQKSAFQYEISQGNLIIKTDELGILSANKNALQTVLQNLICNAVKYQPKDKENHIPTVSINYERSNKYHKIRFADNGIGIDKENISKLFEPFIRFHSSAEYEGTGLGMSICKRILKKHGGDICVESSNSNGTCFRLDIPINIEKSAPKRKLPKGVLVHS